MAHQEQIDFCTSVKALYPDMFKNKRVLDIGSLDINGNNRYLFEDCDYTGIDIGPGPNVDIVCSGHEFKSDEKFDVIISTECFEHDKYYEETLRNAYSLLKQGGLLLFSCAAPGRPEHGTTRTTKGDSPFTNDYYKNLGIYDIVMALAPETPMNKIFIEHKFQTRTEFPQDLYFYGIKR